MTSTVFLFLKSLFTLLIVLLFNPEFFASLFRKLILFALKLFFNLINSLSCLSFVFWIVVLLLLLEKNLWFLLLYLLCLGEISPLWFGVNFFSWIGGIFLTLINSPYFFSISSIVFILSFKYSIFILFSSLSLINLVIFSLKNSLFSYLMIDEVLLLKNIFSVNISFDFRELIKLSLCWIIIFKSFISLFFCSIWWIFKLFSSVIFWLSLYIKSITFSFDSKFLINSLFFSFNVLISSFKAFIWFS